MDDKCNKVCDTLWENIPFHEKQPVTKRQRNQIDRKNAKRNAAVLRKPEPYTGVRTKRSGYTLFELVEKTNTDSKVITFLQDHGCLRTEMSCPSCGEAMVQTDRVDGGLPQSVFRCSKRHGPEKKRCNVRKTVRSNSFFYNANISLFTFVWILWGFCEHMENLWFIRHLGLLSRIVTDRLCFCREVCMVL